MTEVKIAELTVKRLKNKAEFYCKLRINFNDVAVKNCLDRDYNEIVKSRIEKLNEMLEKITTVVIADEIKSTSWVRKREFIEECIARAKKEKIAFETSLQKRKEIVKRILNLKLEINRRISELNKKINKERKISREIERQNFEKGDYEKVSDKYLKSRLEINDYFDKSIVIDKSSRHRAVLFAEVEYDDYYYRIPRYERYNLSGWHGPFRETGKYLLSGIDDNGELWSIELQGDYSTVEEAMAALWDVSISVIKEGKRQGEFIFYKIKEDEIEGELIKEKEWRIRNHDHVIKPLKEGEELLHNDDYVFCASEILVEHLGHPPHPPLLLEPGAYVVYWYSAD